MPTNATHAGHMTRSKKGHSASLTQEQHHYLKLALMLVVHFPVMFAVMYTMVNAWEDVFANLNQVYMAGMMVAPMGAIMLLSMKEMYRNTKYNTAIYAGSTVLFVILLAFMRKQTFVGDHEFVRSMIPHHSGAVLMCNEAKLQDAELKDLCVQIVKNQKDEIRQMKAILGRLSN